MRVLVKEQPKQLVMRDIPAPRPNGEDVIIKVSRVGICGSDVHMWATDDRIGLIMGHEFCGVVTDPGSNTSLKTGDRVVVYPQGRGVFVDLPGAYADYFAAKPGNVLKLPDSIDDDTAAMIEPASVALRAFHFTEAKINEKVLITGAGLIGLLMAEWLRLAGVDYIAMTEVNKSRIEYARSLNLVDDVFDAKDDQLVEKLQAVAEGGFDKVVECTGQGSALALSLDAVKKGGRIMYVGIDYKPFPFYSRPLVANEISLVGSYGSGIPVFQECIHHLAKQRINIAKYVTSHINLEQVQEKIAEIASGQSTEIKSIVVI
ncbi:MAG: zinc-dependent alcohol dehydrogenase [Syntrophomonadaceae bacterium]